MKLNSLALGAVLAVCAFAAHATEPTTASQPSHVGRRTSTPEDERAIHQVIDAFQAAIRSRNILQLSSLMLNAHIPFQAPASPEVVRKQRAERDPHADGQRAGGFRDFARMVETSKAPLEERFYNIRITQDGHVAWVMFDYDFVEGGKVRNHGVETWQMMKDVEGAWKIGSVWWTVNPLP